jgi:uncharacterized membrane protein
VVGYSSINYAFAIALVGYFRKIQPVATTLATTDHRRRLLLHFWLIFKINYHRAASIIATVSCFRFNHSTSFFLKQKQRHQQEDLQRLTGSSSLKHQQEHLQRLRSSSSFKTSTEDLRVLQRSSHYFFKV